jgi:hypothetical protein
MSLITDTRPLTEAKQRDDRRVSYLQCLIGLVMIVGTLVIRFYKTIFRGKSISDIYLAAHWDSIFYPLRAGPNFGMDPTLAQQYMPQLFFLSDYWRHGIPLWNKFTGFGVPFLADPQTFVFSPIFAPFAVFPGMHTWDVMLILELMICAISTYFLALEFESGFIAATAAALMFAFCPWVQSQIEIFGSSICLTPVVFLFFARAAKQKSLWHAVIAGCMAAADVLSGHPEISFVTIIFACLLACSIAIANQSERFRVTFITSRITLAGFVAFGITAPMLIPFGEFLAHADSYKFSCQGSSDVSFSGLLGHYMYPFYGFGTIFLGPLSWLGLGAAFVLCFSKANRFIRPLMICLAIAMLSMTRSFPLNFLFAHRPFSQIHAHYYLATYILLLSLATGLGLNFLISYRNPNADKIQSQEVRRMLLAVGVGGICLLLGPILFSLWQHKGFSVDTFNVDFDFSQQVYRFVWKWWLLNALCVSAAVIAAMLSNTKYLRCRSVAVLVCVSTGIIGLIAGSFESRPVRPTFSYPGTVPTYTPHNENGRFLSIGNHVLRPATNLVYKLPLLTSWNPLYPSGYLDFMTACGSVRDADTITFNASIGKLVDLAGVRYIVSTQPILDERAAAANHTKRDFAVKQILYANQLVLSNVELFYDSKNSAIFCRALATPLKAGSFAMCLEVKDRVGHLLSQIEAQPIWNGFPDQTVICSGALPSAHERFTVTLKVISQSGRQVLPPSVASGGKISPDGSLLIGRSDDASPINEIKNDRFRILSSQQGITTYENKTAMPRSFLVRQIKWCKGKGEAMHYVPAHSDEMRNTVVLEQSELGRFRDSFYDASQGHSFVSSTVLDDTGTIRTIEPSNALTTDSSLDLDVSVPSTSVLVTTDIHYPGWKSSVDGVNCPIFRADSLFRAIIIPAGKHHIRFQYQPLSFSIGLLLAGITLGAICIGTLWNLRKYVPPNITT